MELKGKKLKRGWIGVLLVLIISVSFGMFSSKAEAASYLGNEKKVVTYVKKQMVNRKGTISFTTSSKVYESTISSYSTFQEKIFEDNGKSGEQYGDYLRYHVKSIENTIKHVGNKYKITMRVKYTSTASKEKTVTKKVKAIVKKLDVSKASDYKKVKAVYDYMCKNVVYDNSLKRYSAYHALVGKKAVCQGYAVSVHRLLRNLGVETRIVTGKAESINHAWNIVKINDQWYNLDSTWDSERDNALYFLKCQDDFTDHLREGRFQTKEFLASYPMAEKCYGTVCTHKAQLINKNLPQFTMQTIDGATITKNNCGQGITMFVFYSGESAQSQAVIEKLAKSSLMKDKSVKVICVNTNSESEDTVRKYQTSFGHKKMVMTYMEKEGMENTNFLNMFSFKKAAGIEAYYYPFVFIVDSNKKMRYAASDEISIEECEKVVETLRPDKVKGVKVKKKTKKSVTLQWNKISGATGYYVYNSKTKKIEATVKKNTCTIQKLSGKTQYSYYVVAYNKNGNAKRSATFKVTTN